MKQYLKPISIVTILLLSLTMLLQSVDSTEHPPFPRVWVTYREVNGFDEDFKLLKANGVGAVQARSRSSELPELFAAARQHDMKLIMDVPELSEQAYKLPKDEIERAVMIAGAYQGKAIDRHRFAFSAKEHEIIIENPVYDKENCYDTLGRYFPGMRDPVKAEVIVKEADFDGEQHLKIIPAITSRKDDLHWTMKFDLTGVKGDLDHVILAVYWISEGTRDYWMFGDAASAAAESTKEALAEEVHKEVEQWRKANDGTFPNDLVVAMRFGDECFHVSGHLNSADCSYPLWDYSDSGIEAYKELNPSQTYPRGKPWIDVFGRQAYADWMYTHHRACADLVNVVKETLKEEGLPDLPVFRNITRAGVFSTMNDHDGSGLDLLVQELDIAHLDPYPVKSGGYVEHTIPVDMSYVAGLARRHDKYLVPWLQSHTYWANRGGLTHPDKNQVNRMIKQHLPHMPDALMWLGWGKNYTFPLQRPEAWKEAAEQHHRFIQKERTPIEPKMAVIRPYTVRALRYTDGVGIFFNPQEKENDTQNIETRVPPLDYYVTDTILYDVVMRQQWHYDAFEPVSGQDINANELKSYPLILAELGRLDQKTLKPYVESKIPCVLFVEGADLFDIDKKHTGIRSFEKPLQGQLRLQTKKLTIPIIAADLFKLDDNAKILGRVGDHACVWSVDHITFVSARSNRRDEAFPQWLWKVLGV